MREEWRILAPRSTFASIAPDAQAAGPEYYVLILDDVRRTVEHPTTGRVVAVEIYARDPRLFRRWLRGIVD